MLNLRGSELLPRSEQVASQMLSRPELKSHDYQQSLSVVIWDAQGRVLGQLGEAPVPPFSDAEGFADLVLGSDKTGWRTFARWDRSEPARRLMVMLKEEERDALARDIAGQVAEPGLWLLPTIASSSASRSGRPAALYDLFDHVRAVDVEQQHPLGTRHPQVEFREIVDSINVLMQRSRSALARERQLADEPAHELRSRSPRSRCMRARCSDRSTTTIGASRSTGSRTTPYGRAMCCRRCSRSRARARPR